jgi:eukaryotic-like serine/threonine-protein kinase
VDANQWQRVERLFHQAVALDPAERAEYLARECGTDSSLRAAVEALLQQDRPDLDPIQRAVSRAAEDLLQSQANALLGQRFGAWRLCRQIASGGMGAVYLAERADGEFEQRAALKILSPGLLSADALGRFNAERQILARLSHPNIAHLLDGGTTTEGIPYLVMEYIEGTTIDRYCDERRLDTRSRLRLIQKLCAAVDYAHRNLVIHRDIKPSNVLVDAQGEPKLLDFGVAKLLSGETPVAAPVATIADLRAMTPRYASPEQIKGEIVTTATDVYSLGLLLYELLTGCYPYQEATKTPSELTRAICETEPERPSSAARRGARAGAGAKAANVSRTLAGDLDNIVLMAMRKEPARRYGSPLQLAEDIERHLHDEPVRARSISVAYRTRKFLARHRLGVLGSATATLLVIGIVAFYGIQLAAQRDRARAEAAKASAVSAFMVSLFREADPTHALGKHVDARVLLERGAARAALELEHSPRIRAALLTAIAQSYANLAEYRPALRQTDAALAIERALGPAERPNVEVLERLRGGLLTDLGRYGEARVQLESLHRDDVARYGPSSREAALSLKELAGLAQATGHWDEAGRLYLTAITHMRALGTGARSDLAPTLVDYAVSARNTGKLKEAEAASREALAVERAEYGEVHPEIADTLTILASVDIDEGDSQSALKYLDEALALARRLYGADNLRTARIMAYLGNAEDDAGDLAASVRDSRAALVVFERVLGAGTPDVLYLRDSLAGALLDQGKFAAAYAMYRDDAAGLAQALGKDNVQVGLSLQNEADALASLKRYREASTVADEAEHILQKDPGDYAVELARMLQLRGSIQEGLHRYAPAERLTRQSIEGFDRVYHGKPNVDSAQSYWTLGEILRQRGEPAQAEQALRQSLAEWASQAGSSSTLAEAQTRAELGRALLDEGRVSAAVAELSTAYGWLQSHRGNQDPDLHRVGADLKAARARLPRP